MGFVIHDLKCDKCGLELLDYPVDVTDKPKCEKCKIEMCIRWDISRRRFGVAAGAAINAKDRAIVYINPKTGKPAIPGQDTEFTRRKYEGWGYQRREFETLRELDKFCKQEKLVNEKANFDNGNGIN